MGFDEESNGHHIYWPNRRTVTVERNVEFSTRQIQLVEGEQAEENDGNLGSLDTSITESELPIIPVPEEVSEPLPPEIITGKQVKQPSRKVWEILEGAAEGNKQIKHLTASLAQVTAEVIADPISVAEAQRCPDWNLWFEAMKDEIS